MEPDEQFEDPIFEPNDIFPTVQEERTVKMKATHLIWGLLLILLNRADIMLWLIQN